MRAALGLPTVRDVWHTWTVHTPIVVSLPQLDSAPAAEVGEFSWIGPVIADHLFIADRVAQLGAGISLTPDADADQIRAAAQTILAEPAYRQAAARLQHSIAGTPGVTAAANHLEALTRTETPTDPRFPAATPRWPGDRP